MRSIEEIAADVFNGLPITKAEKQAFYDYYGEIRSAHYGVRPEPPAQEPPPAAPVTRTRAKKEPK